MRYPHFIFLFFISSLSSTQGQNFEGIIKYLLIQDEESSYQCDTIIQYFGKHNYRIEYKRAQSNMEKGVGITNVYYNFQDRNDSYYYSYKTGLNKIELIPEKENLNQRVAIDSTINMLGNTCYKVSYFHEDEAFESKFKTSGFLWVAKDLNYQFPKKWEHLGNGTNKIPLAIGVFSEAQIPTTPYSDALIEIKRSINLSIAFEIIHKELPDSIFKLP